MALLAEHTQMSDNQKDTAGARAPEGEWKETGGRLVKSILMAYNCRGSGLVSRNVAGMEPEP